MRMVFVIILVMILAHFLGGCTTVLTTCSRACKVGKLKSFSDESITCECTVP